MLFEIKLFFVKGKLKTYNLEEMGSNPCQVFARTIIFYRLKLYDTDLVNFYRICYALFEGLN